MQIWKMGRTCMAVALSLGPLSVILSGCKGDYTPRGGPTRVPTPIPGRTPIRTPSSTPGGGNINSNLVGTYTGTFNFAAFQEVNRTLTFQVNGDGSITGAVSLSLGGTLPLTGTVSASGDTLTLTGQGSNATSGAPINITLTGRLNISQTQSVSGSGTVRDQFNDNGTWLARKSAG